MFRILRSKKIGSSKGKKRAKGINRDVSKASVPRENKNDQSAHEDRDEELLSMWTALADSLVSNVVHHQVHGDQSFNLVASNTCCSPCVRKIMGSSLMNSYCNGLPGNRFFGGCSEIDTIERQCRAFVNDVFQSKYCEVQFLSGMMANIAAYHCFLKDKHCTVMAALCKHGGHYSHNIRGPLTRFFDAHVVEIPWDDQRYNVDLEALPAAMETHRPTLLILGWSEMLFEHDLSRIRTICDQYDCKIMYDMSHVAGLVAGGIFQKDVMQYADIVTSSTGKSLHSADHGIVLYNDPALTPLIRQAVMPLLTSNTHFHETAALCMALLEMKAFGGEYGKQVVANTHALAQELTKRHFKVLCRPFGFSNTHELIIDLQGLSGCEATAMLDSANIFVNPQTLPNDDDVDDDVNDGAKSTGIRIGTQVITRRGFKESDMASIAQAMSDVLFQNRHAAIVRRFVAQKCACFSSVQFCFQDSFYHSTIP